MQLLEPYWSPPDTADTSVPVSVESPVGSLAKPHLTFGKVRQLPCASVSSLEKELPASQMDSRQQASCLATE